MTKKVTAVQFDPKKHPWPEELIPWSTQQSRPRDCSFGFVILDGKRISVQTSDWIVTDSTGSSPVSPAMFELLFEPVDGHPGKFVFRNLPELL